MKRFSNVTHITTANIEYNIPETKCGERVVDDSMFVPESEILKKLSGTRPLSDPEIKQFYDFINGQIPKGIKVPFERSSENLDIAILSKDIRDKHQKVDGIITDTLEAAERKMLREAKAKNNTTAKE